MIEYDFRLRDHRRLVNQDRDSNPAGDGGLNRLPQFRERLGEDVEQCDVTSPGEYRAAPLVHLSWRSKLVHAVIGVISANSPEQVRRALAVLREPILQAA
jgi:hypothetical protein